MFCDLCCGTGRTPVPRGMSPGFCGFMAAGTTSRDRRDDGTLLMVCPQCDGTGQKTDESPDVEVLA